MTITIGKAIEILTLDKALEFEGNAKDLEDALQLGVEALRRFQDIRHALYSDFQSLLPGETEE